MSWKSESIKKRLKNITQIILYSMDLNINVIIGLCVAYCCIFEPIKTMQYYEWLNCFFVFLHNNNPTIIDYSYANENATANEKENEKDIEVVTFIEPPIPKHEKYENKYLKKYIEMTNEYIFNADEKLLIEYETNKLRTTMHQEKQEKQEKSNILLNRLLKITPVYIQCNDDTNAETNAETDTKITDINKKMLLDYFDMSEENEDITIHDLLVDLSAEMSQLQDMLKAEEQIVILEDDEELKQQAIQVVIKTKLDNLMNSYVMECTPLGNIYMRYNNYKESFEYFSNNSIPYRYLEPVGRKYVTTFYCKPLFINLEEELKRADEKWEDNKNKPIIKPTIFKLNNNKQMLTTPPCKNRIQPNFALPPQIKAIVNDSTKQLLKEKSNRYTWEGRLSSFNILKKCNKNITNKNLSMSFSDFKRLQQTMK